MPSLHQNTMMENHGLEGQMLFKVISGEGRSAAYYIRLFADVDCREITLPPCGFARGLTLIAPSAITILALGRLRSLRDRVTVAKGETVTLGDIPAGQGTVILRIDILPDTDWHPTQDDAWCAALLSDGRNDGLPARAEALVPSHVGLVPGAAPLAIAVGIAGARGETLGPTTGACVQDTVIFELAPSRAVPFSLHTMQDTILTILASDDPQPEIELVDLRQPPGPYRPRHVHVLDPGLPTLVTIPACCAYRLGGNGMATLRIEYRLFTYPADCAPKSFTHGRDFRSIPRPDICPMQVPPDLPLPPRLLRLFARNDFAIAQSNMQATR